MRGVAELLDSKDSIDNVFEIGDELAEYDRLSPTSSPLRERCDALFAEQILIDVSS